ncbi:MAG TPA: ammonia-forming cytochrome c nitrite reductase subunit c552 [Desulfomonilia bacterium]|nr:ammonia-forming cytochrome c nitrite reductase subunit c552 [Desulfomonilia bacterium]
MKKTLFISLSMMSALVVMAVCTAVDPPTRAQARGMASATGADPRQSGCRSCHERFYSHWSGSPHGLAVQAYSREFAVMALTAQAGDIALGAYRYQADIGDEGGVVHEKGRWPWENTEYRITHVLGGRNVYYFFTPKEGGRLKALPLAYDVTRKAWISTASSGIRHARMDAGPWKDSRLILDTSCYSCHVSPLSTNYDFKADTYRTEIPEPGIKCEACHGPSEEHDRIMRGLPPGVGVKDTRIIGTGAFTADQLSSTCAPCHAGAVPITSSLLPGEPFFDHYDLAALEDRDFSPDGKVLDGSHIYTSWLLNPCARAGKLHCLKCHTPGGGYRFRDASAANDACMPCHEKTVRDPLAHTHHAPASRGSKCTACHMPTIARGMEKRTDHSILPPSPASSMAYDSPDACILCHTDRDHAWADRWVRKWFKRDYQGPLLKRAGLIDAARRKDWSRGDEMIAYLQSMDRDEVYAASIVRLLRKCPDPWRERALRTALKDRSPLVRSSAAEALGAVLSPLVVGELMEAASDPSRLVRIKAAAALLRHGKMVIPDDKARSLGRATGEYLASMMVRQDQWTSHVNMGNYFLDQGDARNALMAYTAASRLDPMAVPPYVSASIAHANMHDLAKAEAELDKALRIDPKNAPALFNMGLLKNDQGKSQEAATYLKEALKNDPAMAAAAYNLAVVLSKESMKEAIFWARKAYEMQPDAKYGYTLAYFLKQDGDWNEGIEVLRRLIRVYPLSTDAYLLLGEIYEKRGRNKDAESVYQQGLSVGDMPDHDKARIEKRMEKLRPGA